MQTVECIESRGVVKLSLLMAEHKVKRHKLLAGVPGDTVFS